MILVVAEEGGKARSGFVEWAFLFEPNLDEPEPNRENLSAELHRSHRDSPNKIFRRVSVYSVCLSAEEFLFFSAQIID